MKRSASLLLVAAVAVLAILSGCSRKARVIPAGKMSRIYAEMFIQDAWLRQTPSERRHADTSLFYEPIFNKYGYSFKDYDRSVNYYLDKPEKYSQILKNTGEILQKQRNYYDSLAVVYQRIERLNSEIGGYMFKDFDEDTLEWQPQYQVEYLDSVVVEYTKEKKK